MNQEEADQDVVDEVSEEVNKNLFTGLKLMNVFNIKFSISPSNFSIPRNLPTCMT